MRRGHRDGMRTGTKLGLGFGGQILLTIALGIGMLWGLAEVAHQFRFVAEHDAPIIANARQLAKLVVDMETGQRGFCITQKESFLVPYTVGSKEFAALVEKEKRMVEDRPGQLEALERIEQLVAKWKSDAAEPEIAMARKVAQRWVDAKQLEERIGHGFGKQLMDEIMTLGHEIEVTLSDRGEWEGALIVEIIEKCMTDRESGERGFLITGKEEFLEKYQFGEQTRLPRAFERLRAYISRRGFKDRLGPKVDRLERLTHEWTQKAAEPEIAARREMNANPETLLDVAELLENGTGKALIDEIRSAFDSFIETEEKLAADRYASATSTVKTSVYNVIIFLLIALVLGVFLATSARRAIVVPLDKLVKGAERVGAGDLNTRVHLESTDEIGELGTSFNAMTKNLAEASARRDEAEEELHTLQRLDSLGVMAGGIAHDFNNLLTGIMCNLSLLEDQVDAHSDLGKLIEESLNACSSARSLTSELLTFAQGGSPVVKVAALGPILQKTSNFATRGSTAKCVLFVDDDLRSAMVDVDQLAQVVQNLVINASQSMPGGGAITITARNVKLEVDEVPSLPAGDYVSVTVADEGEGISKELHAKVFDPYFSTKDKGRGLGLATCHSIIAKHGGHIALSSTLGLGTQATFYLPAADPADIASKVARSQVKKGGGRVLIMDDDMIVGRALMRSLARLGYGTELVADGEQALESYKKAMGSRSAFDVAIMDLTIPGGMGGQEAVRELLEIDPDAKPIVSSGYSNDAVMSSYEQYGFVDVLAKPYTLEDVSEVMRRVKRESMM